MNAISQSEVGHALLSLLPSAAAALYFVGGMLVYALRVARHGEYHDRELASRGSSVFATRWLRMYWAWLTRPWWLVVERTQIPANALTTLSLLLASGAAVLLAMGQLALGGWLVIGGGVLDFLDGRVARARGEASPYGAALDSVLDRFADAVVLVGLAWFYRGTWVLLPALLTVVGSLIISYVRARGEGLGVSVHSGLMQRPERIALLGAALVLSPLTDVYLPQRLPHPLLAFVLVFMAIATNATALGRLRLLLSSLDARPLPRLGVLLGRGSVVRAVLSAATATLADFAVVLALVELNGLSPTVATALGCLVGGITNFALGRHWVFGARGSVHVQAGRYAVVSASSAALNAGAVAILVLTPIDYRLAWVLARVSVFLGWNFPMQRDFVFRAPSRRDGRAAEVSAPVHDGADAPQGERAELRCAAAAVRQP